MDAFSVTMRWSREELISDEDDVYVVNRDGMYDQSIETLHVSRSMDA